MNTEKIVLSFIALLAGLLVAGVAFYLYQSTKIIPDSKTKTISISQLSPTPPQSSIYLNIATPQDEEVIDQRTVTVAGETIPQATILITTGSAEQVVTPASNGKFTTTLNVENGTNKIEITAIAPNGEEISVVKTVTVSNESF